MRKYQNLALLLCSIFIGLHSFAQQPLNQINILSFSVKNKLPADVSGWGAISGGMILTAQRIPQSAIQGIKLVVQIKQGGSKVCGNLIDASPLLDFNAVKTFTAAELNGYISNCNSLKPGNYSVCVQFFNLDRYPISKEVCKEFVVEDVVQAQQNYSPPQNISPVNEKKFKVEEVKAGVTFRWTPVLPKPKDQVTYRLKVWQLMQGQNGNAAMKSNNPVVEKDIENITQAIITNLYTGPCKPPYLCDYVWNVQALNKEGKPVGINNGMSEATAFSISTQYIISLDSLKVKCTEKDGIYSFSYIIKNLNASVAEIVSVVVQSSVPTGATIGSFTPAIGSTIPVGGSVTVTGVINAGANFSNICIKTKIQKQGDPGKNAEDYLCADVPSCRCNLCDTSIAKWEIQSEIKYDSTATNNILTLHNDVSFSPYNIVKLSTEIVDFYWYTEGDCKKCNTNDYYFGNLISGSISGTNFTNAGTSVAGPGGTPIPSSHQIDFIANSPAGTHLSNDVYLNISLPPQTQLSCCTDCFRFCIRYTVTFMQDGICKTCSIVKCYESKRKHRKVGQQQQQLNQCGEGGIIVDNTGGLNTNNK